MYQESWNLSMPTMPRNQGRDLSAWYRRWYTKETKRRWYPHGQWCPEASGWMRTEGNLCQGKGYYKQACRRSTQQCICSPHSSKSHPPEIQQRYLDLQNAFSTKLGPHGFDFYSLFVPDLLHEFDLGVWKAVFTHLIRVLYAAGGDAIQALNER